VCVCGWEREREGDGEAERREYKVRWAELLGGRWGEFDEGMRESSPWET